MTPRARDAHHAIVAVSTSASSVSSKRSRLLRTLAKVAGGLGGATLLIGAMHMPFARGLLMRVGGCPLAGAKMTPAQMDTARHLAMAANHATTEARARPALGFALDATTLADVHTWAARTQADCDDVREGIVKCEHVAPKALGLAAVEGTIDELTLGFDARGHLVNVTTLRAGLRPDEAACSAQGIVSSLYGSLGVATESAGDFAATHLAQAGAASLATRSYRYRDYVADVTAMNFPATGLALREHYMSAND
jgi:hypothetical protein